MEMEKEEEKKVVLRAWDCGSPLYDSFELASVYHVLDNNLMALPFAWRSAQSRDQPDGASVLDMLEGAPARRLAAKAKAKGPRRRKAAAAARRTGKAVLHSICRSVTCGRRF